MWRWARRTHLAARPPAGRVWRADGDRMGRRERSAGGPFCFEGAVTPEYSRRFAASRCAVTPRAVTLPSATRDLGSERGKASAARGRVPDMPHERATRGRAI
eukprot:4017493-Pyramimonas_sp.AAC.3